MKLLLLLCLFSSSVQSCRTVSRSGVTVTGVCPNDTFIIPIGAKRTYHCSFNNGNMFFLYYWNISGNIGSSTTAPIPPVVGIATTTNDSTVTIVADANEVLDIQFGLCNTMCSTIPEEFIGTESVQLITFGKY